MTKNFLRLMTPVAIAAVSCAVLSCSDDDEKATENTDEETTETIDTSGRTPVSPVIATLDGNRLALKGIKRRNYAEWSFSYDDNWLCSSFGYDDYDSFSVSYNPCVMTYSDGGEQVRMQVSLNSAGYASKIVINSTDEDGDSEQATYQFVYNSGYMTQASVSSIWDEGQAYASSVSTFTWRSGNLTSVATNGVEMDPDDGGLFYYNTKWTFDYSEEVNIYQQFTVAQSQIIEEEIADDFEYLTALGFMGLLGKGTAYLPSEITFEETDDSGTESGSYAVSYTLNSNGTIDGETLDNTAFSYSYCTEGEGSELERGYFSIEDATYFSGDFPEATTNTEIQGLTLNSQALSGGFNFITIVCPETYLKFFVGVKGVSGYYEYEAQSESSGSDYNSYLIPISYSEDYDEDITMLISAQDANGGITKATEEEIKHVSSESGDLNVNLTFSNAKDVDLHLYMPDGEHIYYSHRGGTVTASDGSTVTYGLDHDSNAACGIDNLNNENIYIPAALIQSGTYTVKVDMYANCDRTTATSWSVVARYKGDLVQADGDNPVSGVYPVGAGTGDMTTVMTFTISAGGTRSAALRQKSAFRLVPTPPSDIDLMKLEELSFREEED